MPEEKDVRPEKIEGEQIILRPRRREDAAFFAHWYNQPEVMFQCGFTELTNEEKEREIISRREEDAIWFTITDKEGTILGETGLLRMWPVWHCTDLSIIIPDPEHQHRGYGSEAMKMMLKLAFETYAMNRVAIGVVGKNVNALNFYRKIGFKEEGIQEQGYYWNGEYSDFIMMRLLRQEWEFLMRE